MIQVSKIINSIMGTERATRYASRQRTGCNIHLQLSTGPYLCLLQLPSELIN